MTALRHRAGGRLAARPRTLEGLLLGSILAATDGAAIFALLRGSTLRRRLARTLEGRPGFNDPVAVLLVLGFIDWIQHPATASPTWPGCSRGARHRPGGRAWPWAARRSGRSGAVRLETAGLYPVASIATAALAYGGAASSHGSGFLAVYLAGLALGGAHIPAKRTVTAFHEGLAWVAQIALFLTLGLLVFPSQLGDVLVDGTLIALVLVLRGAAAGHRSGDRFRSLHASRAAGPRLGRPARRGARGAGDLPGDRAACPEPRVLQHRLLRGGHLDHRPGHHLRAAGQAARG